MNFKSDADLLAHRIFESHLDFMFNVEIYWRQMFRVIIRESYIKFVRFIFYARRFVIDLNPILTLSPGFGALS